MTPGISPAPEIVPRKFVATKSPVPSIPADRLELVYPDGPPPWDVAPDCAAVCVGGRYTKQAARVYADTGIQIVTLVDWPSGIAKPTVRQIEAVAAAKDGTHAIEIPAPPEFLRTGDIAALTDDLSGVAAAVREVSRAVQLRVWLDNAQLVADRECFGRVCTAVREWGGDAVVISARTLGADRLQEIKHDAHPLHILVRCELDPPEPWIVAAADRVSVVHQAAD